MIKSRQVIDSYSECREQHPRWSDQAIEDYQATKQDINNFIDLANSGAFSPQFGTGSPEGVVTANYSLLYIDTAVPTMYYNETFGANTGWTVV